MSPQLLILVFFLLQFHALQPLSMLSRMRVGRRIYSATVLRSSSSLSPPSPATRYCVLKPGKSRLFKDGNPIVYGGAIDKVFGEMEAGGEIYVLDHKQNIIGRGFYNPHSQYRVRLLVLKNEDNLFEMPLKTLIHTRIKRAKEIRAQISLPSETDTVYRLINGEGDRLGGLIVDVFDNVIVVQSSALWVELYSKYIEDSLRDHYGSSIRLIWRRASSRLLQDGANEIDGGLPPPPTSDEIVQPLYVCYDMYQYDIFALTNLLLVNEILPFMLRPCSSNLQLPQL
jgi:hypothetical protein